MARTAREAMSLVLVVVVVADSWAFSPSVGFDDDNDGDCGIS
jgi:hypothetical protein